MPRRKKFTEQDLVELENDLIEHILSGQEPPPAAERFLARPEFVEKLEARKAELKTERLLMAKHVLSSAGMVSLAIAGTLKQVTSGVSQESLQDELPALMAKLKSGDGTLLEEMLLGQSLALQALSCNLIAQAGVQSDLNAKQPLLHLGLKASNQLRQTVSTLNELRNPKRAVFIRRQLNQQLNFENSKKLPNSANELLAGYQNGSSTLDTIAESKAGRTNQEMEPLASEYRPPNNSREANQPS